MKKHKILRLAFLAALLILAGCSRREAPAKILAFHAFYTDYSSGSIGFYIDWQNVSSEKTVDFLILSISFDSKDAAPMRYRILEPEGIAPGTQNTRNNFEIKQVDLPSEGITSLQVSILQVGYTDGSVWENGGNPAVLSCEIDGEKGEGAFPAQINEAVFYTTSETSISINCQLNWTNRSKTASILEVVYKITAKSADGAVIPDKHGSNALFITEKFSSSQWCMSGLDHFFSQGTLSIYDFNQKSPAIYETSICKAVDSKGNVWKNLEENDKITAIFCGKKGYRFGTHASTPSIQALIHRIAEEGKKYALDLSDPELFIREQSHCILRYADVDVRAELSETNEVLPDKTGFVYYSQGISERTNANLQSYLDKMSALRLCICAAALTELPNQEVIQKVDAYNNNKENHIDFPDPAYETFEDLSRLLDKYGTPNPCGIFTAGKDLYDPMEAFFWAGENPYTP